MTGSSEAEMKKSICIISLSPIARDARVLRQIKYLAPLYDLKVIGYGPFPSNLSNNSNITWIPVNPPSQSYIPNFVTALKNRDWGNIRFWERVFNKISLYIPILFRGWYRRQPNYREAWRQIINTRCDAYHANDWNTLPLAADAAMKNNAPLVLDLHEYAPLEYENRPRWWIQQRFITYVLKKYTPMVSASITVAELIAQRYRDEFGLDPTVIMNAPEKLTPLPHLKQDNSIRLIHHGVASPIRHPELMIETVARCDERYTLHLMFLPNEYVEELKVLADRRAPGRVFFNDPVAPEDITRTIALYDVGFFPIPPVNYNYHACLPNKFFDFICSGLAVAVGPSPSMAEIVDRYGLGIVCSSFNPDEIASALNNTTQERWNTMRQAARNAADELNAHNEMKKLVNIYQRLLPSYPVINEENSHTHLF